MRRISALFVLAGAIVTVACERASPVDPSLPAPEMPGEPSPRIAFVSDREGSTRIYIADEDGSNVTLLTAGDNPAWSHDGRRIAFNWCCGFWSGIQRH